MQSSNFIESLEPLAKKAKKNFTTTMQNQASFNDYVIFEIAKNLSLCELSTFAMISKKFNEISNMDGIWLPQLVKDFYFTKENAFALKTRLKTNYKNAYRYCQRYQFNEEQNNALLAFKKNGLTKNHLSGRDEFNHPYHYLALKHLLTKDYSIEQAMQELSGLNHIQADGIRYDVPKEELKPLSTIEQVYTIERYYKLGVRAIHLKELNKNFSICHADAMATLLKKEGNKFNILLLIAQLNQLTFTQASYIALTNGELVPSDLCGLSEDQLFHAKIIFDKKKWKINPDDLIHRQWTHSADNMKIFSYLILYKEKSVSEALQLVDEYFENNLLPQNKITKMTP